MAEGTDNDAIHANLICPLCLSTFEKATLLTCGHTFCLKCLMGYDKEHRNVNLMICPLCREQTPLGENRVQGLPKNVTVNALVDDLQARMSSEKRLSQVQATNEVQPQAGQHKLPVKVPVRPPKIVKDVDLPGGVRGMTSLADDSVVVGYGSSFPGAEVIKVSGERRPYSLINAGSVRDIVILNDGRAVASHGFEEIKAYNSDGTMWVIPFMQLSNKKSQDAFCTLYKDSQDFIYAANGTNKVQYFRVRSKGMTHHSKVISTGKSNVAQICVTQSEALVMKVSNAKPRRLALFDKEGNMGSTVIARDDSEVLCATVDALDRVIIGYFSPSLGTLRLSICTLKGLHIKHQHFFSELYLSPARLVWCYLVSISPNLLAFAHLGNKLYFIKVPPIPNK
ncbi:uncharacterized protein LOC135155184 [Lytechinus pictus]|uniref:uncharacterized protein LOC135155184 n=1 Tax=Lytechinus pictus TaxID=7653 RepID=UPI0030B9D789